MRKAIVGTKYGKQSSCSDEVFPFAKRKICMGCVIPIFPIKRLALVYHCPICDSIYRTTTK